MKGDIIINRRFVDSGERETIAISDNKFELRADFESNFIKENERFNTKYETITSWKY